MLKTCNPTSFEQEDHHASAYTGDSDAEIDDDGIYITQQDFANIKLLKEKCDEYEQEKGEYVAKIKSLTRDVKRLSKTVEEQTKDYDTTVQRSEKRLLQLKHELAEGVKATTALHVLLQDAQRECSAVLAGKASVETKCELLQEQLAAEYNLKTSLQIQLKALETSAAHAHCENCNSNQTNKSEQEFISIKETVLQRKLSRSELELKASTRQCDALTKANTLQTAKLRDLMDALEKHTKQMKVDKAKQDILLRVQHQAKLTSTAKSTQELQQISSALLDSSTKSQLTLQLHEARAQISLMHVSNAKFQKSFFQRAVLYLSVVAMMAALGMLV